MTATLNATRGGETMSRDYYNQSKTLRVYREKYRSGHPMAGQYNQVWKARIKIRKGLKPIILSTGTRDKDTAIRIGEQKLHEFTSMDAMGLSVSPLTFSELARRYLKYLEHRDPYCSEEKLEFHTRTVNLHLDPKFGKQEIGKITSGNLNQFFKQLETTPMPLMITHNGTRTHKRPRNFYSPSAINKIKQVVRGILRYARDNEQVINVMPEIASTVDKLQKKKSLDRETWEDLLYYLENQYVRELDRKPTDQSRPKYYRQSFVDYTKLVVWTGLRASEALRLQWRDFSLKAEDNSPYCLIHVAAREKKARKTGERLFRAHEQVYELLMERKTRVGRYTEDTDYIFTHFDERFGVLENGRIRPINSFRTQFNNVMETLELLHDENGKKRVVYEFRHLHSLLSREQGKSIDDIAEDIGNLTTTTERYYLGRGQGLRKGEPIKI